MIGRRAAVGLSLLSMLVCCALAAPSAFATKGTTGFACVEVFKNADWADPHCAVGKGFGEGYEHEEITPGTETANTSVGTTNAVLTGTVGGLKAIVTSKNVHSTGTQTNNAGPPMNVSGTITTEFTENTATLNKVACESVNNGEAIKVNAVTSTPTEAMEVKFAEDGEAFAKFNIKCAGKNFEITAKGSATGIPEGATVKYTKASTEGIPPESNKVGLFVGGQIAWVEATTTATMSTSEPGIALTTAAS